MGDEVIAKHQLDRNRREQFVVDTSFAKVDELVIVALGQGAGLFDVLCLGGGRWREVAVGREAGGHKRFIYSSLPADVGARQFHC